MKFAIRAGTPEDANAIADLHMRATPGLRKLLPGRVLVNSRAERNTAAMAGAAG
jgi:hypothetical protein